jgi:hypothetical protein
MEDYYFPFPTASGFLTRFTDFQRENPDRFNVNIATGSDGGSGDDLYITGYDSVAGRIINFFISASGDEFRFLTIDPNAPPPPQDEPPPSDDLPFVNLPGLEMVNFMESVFGLGGAPQNLLPAGFFFGGGYDGYGFGFDNGGPSSSYDGRIENTSYTDSPDAEWLASVGGIY